MKQISLKKLDLYYIYHLDILDIPFITYPGAMDCLKDLSELRLSSSDLCSKFFHQLSQSCHHIQSFNIIFEGKGIILDGLSNLISVQRNLKYLKLSNVNHNGSEAIIVSLINHSNTLIKLNIYGIIFPSFSFINNFTNLQELVLSLVFMIF